MHICLGGESTTVPLCAPAVPFCPPRPPTGGPPCAPWGTLGDPRGSPYICVLFVCVSFVVCSRQSPLLPHRHCKARLRSITIDRAHTDRLTLPHAGGCQKHGEGRQRLNRFKVTPKITPKSRQVSGGYLPSLPGCTPGDPGGQPPGYSGGNPLGCCPGYPPGYALVRRRYHGGALGV